ncbi:hypothetical protein GGR50DRAFT_689910 [Xylaria sp. CBS 124048]|nr:hypothetical protein GGR50DRAFT_689910 [Xylaria sp. CBS 124048]
MQGNGAAAANVMAVGPTPAGHQAELNIIYGMVEELSRQLAENRRVTEDIVSSLGRVRNQAHERGRGNDELLGEATDELFAQEHNLEAMLSILTESLDRAKQSRDANFTLLATYAKVFESIINQFHVYKQRHVADVAAWHRSYRAQLAEARAENCQLRDQMWEMQAHATRANELLRVFRKKFDEDEARWERRISEKAKKQELRLWKRMAMPEIDENEEGVWSDDDDLIDPVEKARLKNFECEITAQALASLGGPPGSQRNDVSDDGETGEPSLDRMMGGVAMERDRDRDSVPTSPSRPASTGSTRGHASGLGN